jgi:hypothetical protein
MKIGMEKNTTARFEKKARDISSYVTTSYIPFSAPYTGWYWMYVSTGTSTDTNAFIRFGIVETGKYRYVTNGQQGAYKYNTSPMVHINAGETMMAQANENTIANLYCVED